MKSELLSQSKTSLILMTSFSEPAQECRIRPTGHTQDTKKQLLQTHVASMQSATWLFESEGVYLWSVWPQLNNTVCKPNIHGHLNNHYPTTWIAHLGKPSGNECCTWFSAIKALLLWLGALTFLLTCVLRYFKLGTQNWNILNQVAHADPGLQPGNTCLFSLH